MREYARRSTPLPSPPKLLPTRRGNGEKSCRVLAGVSRRRCWRPPWAGQVADEPLSNLDAKLRVEMRAEIRQLQQQLKITTIYVTHDQEEALAMSDRIAVMRGGKLEQVASPQDIYHAPATPFVAELMGATNLLSGTVGRRDGEAVCIRV